MANRTMVLVTVVFLGLAHAGTAVAGGWAITQIEDAPTEFEANTTYEIRYTILQHGKSPADVESTSIVFTPADGKDAVVFPGQQTGKPGQYVAEVNLPKAGSWSWEVSQGLFGVQELGTVTVLQANGSTQPAIRGNLLRVGLPLATLIALGLLTAQVILFRSRRDAGLPASVD